MKYSIMTDKGKIRETNQDRCCCKELSDNCSLAVVCDGMGGKDGGDIASETAVGIIESYICKNWNSLCSADNIKKLISTAIEKANREVFSIAQKNSSLKGMGTTAVVAVAKDNNVYIGHVGDSRAYLYNGKLERITKDHSLVQYLVDTGVIKPENAATHPKRNYITRALGVSNDVEVDLTEIRFPLGARLLLCSDGLYNYISEDALSRYLKIMPLEELSESFINKANSNGGGDNISAVVIENRESGSDN